MDERCFMCKDNTFRLLKKSMLLYKVTYIAKIVPICRENVKIQKEMLLYLCAVRIIKSNIKQIRYETVQIEDNKDWAEGSWYL